MCRAEAYLKRNVRIIVDQRKLLRRAGVRGGLDGRYDNKTKNGDNLFSEAFHLFSLKIFFKSANEKN